MPKCTALYCRTATPDYEGIVDQRDALYELALQQGFGSLAYYEDNGCSGLDLDRPALSRLERDIQNGRVARVLVTNINRLGRNTAAVMRWLVWLRRLGVEIFTLDDEVDWNDLLSALEGGPADE